MENFYSVQLYLLGIIDDEEDNRFLELWAFMEQWRRIHPWYLKTLHIMETYDRINSIYELIKLALPESEATA